MDRFTLRYKYTFEMQKGLVVSHEMDVHGRHRLVIHDCPTIGDAVIGEWSGYIAEASVEYGNRRFIAFTAYQDEVLPIEQPLELIRGTLIRIDEDQS